MGQIGGPQCFPMVASRQIDTDADFSLRHDSCALLLGVLLGAVAIAGNTHVVQIHVEIMGSDEH